MKRIVTCFPVNQSQLKQIQNVASGYEVVDAGQEAIAAEILNADIFCGHAKVPMPWNEVVLQGRLKWIQSSAAGLDHCLVPEVVESAISVTSASGLFANQVAEQTFALLFGLIRRIPTFIAASRAKEFIRRPTLDFHGKTVGIVGFGGNGRRIAQLLAPFGNRILATDVFPVNKPDWVEQLLPADRLYDLLAQSEVVILCVPLTPATQHLMDAAALDAMKPGSLLINVARGRVIDEVALIARLKSGKLAAAGLDVTYQEPLPLSSELWELENVLITPHVGAQSATRVSDTVAFFCENLARFSAGQQLKNSVDKELGFPRPESLVE
ncbi:MAG: D-2-hydroxyacid dehydrogenase [Planctomycetota bacterium]|nr:D-2-hydroxyacid dehydrogenase [Planctomycetota bacterium]